MKYFSLAFAAIYGCLLLFGCAVFEEEECITAANQVKLVRSLTTSPEN